MTKIFLHSEHALTLISLPADCAKVYLFLRLHSKGVFPIYWGGATDISIFTGIHKDDVSTLLKFLHTKELILTYNNGEKNCILIILPDTDIVDLQSKPRFSYVLRGEASRLPMYEIEEKTHEKQWNSYVSKLQLLFPKV